MIEPNELRLDNWILFKKNTNDKGKYQKVFTINTYGASLDKGKGNPCDKHLIFPIDLTEEILIKFPSTFKKSENKILSYCIGNISLNFKGFAQWNISIDEHQIENLIIQSVHQLQNLYFSLTGEEIELELNEKTF